MRNFQYLLISILVLLNLKGRSQSATYHFEHLTVNDGITQGIINDIFQDRYGFMWFATQDGLNLYDGYKITAFKHELNNEKSVAHNGIWNIYEDKQGDLWIGTYDGISLFDRRKKNFRTWRNDIDDAQSLSNRAARTIGEDSHGNLWIGTYVGLNRFNKETGTFHRYFHISGDSLSLSHNYITTTYLDSKGKLWIGTRQGLNYYDEKRDCFKRYLSDRKNSNSISNNIVNSVYEDEKGNLWVGTCNGLNLFDESTGRFRNWQHQPDNPHSLSHNHITSLCKGPKGTIWVGTLEGLNLFDPGKEVAVRLVHNINDPRSLNLNAISKVYAGSGDVLWIGTKGAGINKLDMKKQAFEHWSPSQLHGKALSDYRIGPIFIDKNFMWIGTASGLDAYRTGPALRKYKSYHVNGPEGLSDNYISVIYQDKGSNLWVGTRYGLNLFNKKTETFDSWLCDKSAPKGLEVNFIKSIQEDKNGNLWVGTKKKLYHFNVEKKSFVPFDFDPELPGIKNNGFESLFYDRKGNLWIGSGGAGLGQLIPESHQVKWYAFDREDKNSLSNNKIFAFHEDQQGNLWIGTRHGLNKYAREDMKNNNGIFRRYTEKDGLCNNLIYGILEDDFNNLWISTSKGLAKFDPSKEVFRNYDVSDGLYSSAFEYGYFKDKNGKFYFGGLNGLTTFHPENIIASDHLPPIRITDFRVLNKSLPFEMDGIELDYSQSYFSFEFAALDYSASGKINYAYQLKGLNDQWVHTQNDRVATFTQLSPGSYTFNVKASNREGTWTEDGISIPILIIPPWYRTSWAYMLYVALSAAIIIGVFRFRLSRLRLYDRLSLEHQQAEKWKELDRVKTNFFSNITHEFRTPLTLILGPLQKLRQQHNRKNFASYLDMIERNGNHLKTLIDQLLDLSKLEANSMECSKRYGDIMGFIKEQCELFQEIARQKNIEFIVEVNPNQLGTAFDDDKLHKILLNLLSNAFKYTNVGGKVFLMTEADPMDKQLKLAIKDTGAGIEQQHLPHVFDRFYQANPTRLREGTGIGLALCKELAELQGGEIKVNSMTGIGTEFTVYLPLSSYDIKIEEVNLPVPVRTEVDTNEVLHRFPEIKMDSLNTTPEDHNKMQNTKQLVLVVDDNTDILQFVKALLSDAGYKVLAATNAQKGWQLAQSNIPDIIVSDIVMDEMDGYDFCKLIKESHETSHIPVILLTVKSALSNKLNALSLGADVYLPKPFNADELLMHIKSLITLRKLLQVKYQKQIKLGEEVVSATSMEEEFLSNIRKQVKMYFQDQNFGVEMLAEEMNMSRSQLHRKLSALTGYTVVGFIRSYRLQQALQLLKQNAGTTADIAFKCGFSSPAYFSKKFADEFGYPPKNVRKGFSKKLS